MNLVRNLLSIALCAGLSIAVAQTPDAPPTELLWKDGAPGAVGTEDLDKPTITIYIPKSNAIPTGVVVFPGGGYRKLSMDHEGEQIAHWLNSLGVAAFVVKYRLGPRYHHPAMIDDAHRAIHIVRTRAHEFGIAPDRIGVWGFSAGGHLASTASTHFTAETRPDFAILTYPVISFTTPYTHEGSRKYLLGDNPDPKLVESLSNELQVTKDTPPTFLVHANDDKTVPPENSILYYMALRKAGVPAELHIYARGGHGFGLGSTDAILSTWPARLADWLQLRGYLR
ncbi:MAG TPA: alpha/beta hydrolase [Bryobacteraceae bacterium]|jgi:acetyl esterase/lipase